MKNVADIMGSLPGLATPGDPFGPPGRSRRADTLREKAREFVGLTFFAPLLKQASNPALKGKYGHGGRGEEVFRGQLNQVLAIRMGQSGRVGLADALVKRLTPAGEVPPENELDTEA
jgi:Rod binding domain-containing protein